MKPFVSDGCSGGYSAFVRGCIGKESALYPFCYSHDYAYWHGGSKQKRLQADRRLRDRVLRYAAACEGLWRIYLSVWALVSFALIRIFGASIFPFSWRWGYGLEKGDTP